MQEHIALSWKMLFCPIFFHWKYFNTENSLHLLLCHKPVGLSQLSLFLLIKLFVSIIVIQSCFCPSLLRVRFCPTSCLEHDHYYWSSTPLFAIFQPLLPLLVTRGCLDLVVLLQTLPRNSHWLSNSKESFPTVGHLLWSLSHWPISLLIIFLCSPICQSVCIHWVCLISFYSINSLEQRFLEGFTARFPKYKNSSNREEASPARVSWEQKGHCLCGPVYH